MGKILINISIFLFLTSLPLSVNGQTWQDSVDAVGKHYTEGQYDDAELNALRFISRLGSAEPHLKAELYRILAFISIARGDRAGGLKHFTEALRLMPELKLDRALTSPKIYAVFEQAKTEYDQAPRESVSISDAQLQFYKLRLEAGRRSLVFPGTGQLHKGHKIKGMLYIGTASAAVIGLTVTHASVLRRGDKYHDSINPAEAPSLYREYEDMWKLRNIFGAGLAAVWITGVFEAFLTAPDIDIQPDLSLSGNLENYAGISISFSF
ncbi:MAG: hypothetical protein P9L92_18680 [Candidatus Electryonea clarkiae]|nr:hypothetical protein [Candidatus Electryonea clarkiae]MDP8288044.1 hypothetical protein [Candidatus Electryonea clarkiae]